MEMMNQMTLMNQNQSKAMETQNNALAALTEKLSQLTSQNSKLEAEIFKLKTTPKPQAATSTYIGAANTSEKRPFQAKPEWELNKYGKPFRCRKCGLLGHKDQNCKGTHLTCNKCQQVGHIAPACQMSKN